jgi:hypothetical protein
MERKMSNLIFTACWFPSEELVQESGAKKIAYCFESANIRQARAKATMDFVVQYPEADDEQYEMFIYQDDIGIPRPSRGCWSEEFLYETEWNSELCHPVVIPAAKETSLIEFLKLPANQRLAVLVKYGMQEITTDLLPDAVELLQDDAGTFEGHIVEALHREGSISSMFVERQLELISSIKETQPKTKKWPEILSYVKGWLKALKADRKEGSKTENEEQEIPRPKRTYNHTHQTLDQEVAVAFWPGDVDPGNVSGEVLRWAKKEIMDKDREDWKRFAMSMRTQPNSLKYDLLTVRDVVQNRPTDIHKSPVDLNNYIENFLTTKGVFENADEQAAPSTSIDMGAQAPSDAGVASEQPNAQPTEETPPVERQGPFYYRYADSSNFGRANKLAKLEEMIAAGCIEITKDEYQQLKSGEISPEEIGKRLAAQRGEFVEGISDPNDSRFVKTEGDSQEANADLPVSPAAAVAAAAAAAQHEPATEQPASFVTRADQLEKELGDSENLKLWRKVMRTNPRYTKDLSGTGFEGTSINAEYMIMRATEIFGPVGIGWGFDVLEDQMLPGAPMSEAIYEGSKFVGKKLIRDAGGNLTTSLHHSIKISFWYLKDGKKGHVTSYGATDYMYMTNKNGIKVDGEAQKKSLTDAIKKALSLLGFSADVWLGLFDDAVYKAESKMEFEIKDASEKADDSNRVREELDERFKANVETMRNAVSTNEVSKIASGLTRAIGIHLKAAREKADSEYVKYLEGRLRRLEEVKNERMKELGEKA